MSCYYELEQRVTDLLRTLEGTQVVEPLPYEDVDTRDVEVLCTKIQRLPVLLEAAKCRLEMWTGKHKSDICTKCGVQTNTVQFPFFCPNCQWGCTTYVMVRCLNDATLPDLRIFVDFETETLGDLKKKIDAAYGCCAFTSILLLNFDKTLKQMGIQDGKSLSVVKVM
jgi:hypothetical protein